MDDVGQTICFPLTKQLQRGNPNCDASTWRVLERLGEESVYASVWQACCGEKCDYVLKYQAFGKPPDPGGIGEFMPLPEVTPEMIEREIKMQQLVYKAGLAPKVIDSWLCEKGGAIIMRALNCTVKKLFRDYNDSRVRRKIFGSCLGLITQLHNKGYSHGDSHLNNIMVSYDPYGYEDAKGYDDLEKKYDTMDYTFKFIDLEKAQILGEFSPDKQLNMIYEDYRTFALSLNSLMLSRYEKDNEGEHFMVPGLPEEDIKPLIDIIQSYMATLR